MFEYIKKLGKFELLFALDTILVFLVLISGGLIMFDFFPYFTELIPADILIEKSHLISNSIISANASLLGLFLICFSIVFTKPKGGINYNILLSLFLILSLELVMIMLVCLVSFLHYVPVRITTDITVMVIAELLTLFGIISIFYKIYHLYQT
ncbi:MAG TPA: hypothetical protein P5140_07930 [Methanofastidiosum sp.]|nr:hypothetical protein [Methanofastidiosum sp.]HRS26450.1 hypothetical protein [Methanofastidiosum sp.]